MELIVFSHNNGHSHQRNPITEPHIFFAISSAVRDLLGASDALTCFVPGHDFVSCVHFQMDMRNEAVKSEIHEDEFP
jgi:hypothetical protein